MDKKVQWAMVGAFWFLVLGVVSIGWHVFVRHPAVESVLLEEIQTLPKTAQCPVTGKILTVNEKTPLVRYQGKVYFFAEGKNPEGFSPRDQFLMNPSNFVKTDQALEGR